MKREIEKIISGRKTIKIDIKELEKILKEELGEKRSTFFYKEMADCILKMVEEGKLAPYKNSEKYIMDGRIYSRYKQVEIRNLTKEEKLKNEMLTNYHPKISLTSYLKDMKEYIKDRDVLLKISHFLTDKSKHNVFLTVNERSYEIFEEEKFLNSKRGIKILNNIGLEYEDLYCFKTYEPFFHFGIADKKNDSILIVENKDTFFSLKKLMMEGISSWGGITFSMIIYGEGNKIAKSIEYLDELDVPSSIKIYYFGDLDPAGITIYNRVRKNKKRNVSVMNYFYNEMWKRRKSLTLKTNQIWDDEAIEQFLSETTIDKKEVKFFLQEKKYIPQEVLNISTLREISNNQTTKNFRGHR